MKEISLSILIEKEFVITSQSHHNKHDDDALSFYTQKTRKSYRTVIIITRVIYIYYYIHTKFLFKYKIRHDEFFIKICIHHPRGDDDEIEISSQTRKSFLDEEVFHR